MLKDFLKNIWKDIVIKGKNWKQPNYPTIQGWLNKLTLVQWITMEPLKMMLENGKRFPMYY